MPDFREFDQEYYAKYTRVQRLTLKRTRKSRLLLTSVCILTIIGALAYAAFIYADELWAFVARQNFDYRLKAAGSEIPREEEQRWLNVLLVGVDQRKNEPARADTLMVAMLNLKDNNIHVISIPRDTRVEIEGLAHRTRINHAHSNGGAELTRKTVERLLGIPVHNYVEVNFDGFKNIIDAVGGVEMEVEKRMHYPVEDIDLYKGLQRLDGHGALGYVRYRSDGKGDLPRIERQHKFLSALADELLQPKTVIRIPKIAGELYSNISADMSLKDLIILAGQFKDITPENIGFSNVPGAPRYINGASYYIIDEEKLQIYIDNILNGRSPEITPETSEEQVLPERERR